MRYKVESSDEIKNPGFQIYVNDDFKLNYRFMDHRYSPAVLIPPKYINFVFTYSVMGRSETYVASNINGVLTNCFIDNATNQIKVIFENHNLKPGKLVVNQRFIINDPEFPSGKADRHQLVDTQVILVDKLYE